MAKQQRIRGNSMNHTKPSICQELKHAAKMERYCQNVFGMSFMEKMEDRIFQVRKEFTNNIIEHIKEAERTTGKDYFEIK